MNNPIEDMASAVYSAILRDLPEYESIIQTMREIREEIPGTLVKRRYHIHEISACQFVQTWGSTALGFGGIGGQALTSAYTTIISTPDYSAVYFGGRFAYLAKTENKEFQEDFYSQRMAEVSKSHKYQSV